jgi:hypothetical protein
MFPIGTHIVTSNVIGVITGYYQDLVHDRMEIGYVVNLDNGGFWSKERDLFISKVLVHTDNVPKENIQ